MGSLICTVYSEHTVKWCWLSEGFQWLEWPKRPPRSSSSKVIWFDRPQRY